MNGSRPHSLDQVALDKESPILKRLRIRKYNGIKTALFNMAVFHRTET